MPSKPVEQPAEESRSRFWCVECEVEMTPTCEESGHLARPLAWHHKQQVGQHVEQLRRLKEKLVAKKQLHVAVAAAVQRGLTQCEQQLNDLENCLQGLNAGGDIDQQLAQAQQLLQSGEEDDQVLQLLREDQSISISGSTWQTELQLRENDPTSQLVLFLSLYGTKLQAKAEVEEVHENKSSSTLDSVKGKFKNSSTRPNPAATPTEKVQVLNITNCNRNGDWALQLLNKQALALEELELNFFNRGHLQAVKRMPRLRSLKLCDYIDYSSGESPLRAQRWLATNLQTLVLSEVPKSVVLGLIRNLGHSLKNLEIDVGFPHEAWAGQGPPSTYNGLPYVLSSLKQLRVLKVHRDCFLMDGKCGSRCLGQLSALNKVLSPRSTVICDECGRRSVFIQKPKAKAKAKAAKLKKPPASKPSKGLRIVALDTA